MEPRPRPWSIVLTVPASTGACYFKTTAPEMANDAALTDLLAGEASDLVLTPIAVDLDTSRPHNVEALARFTLADDDLAGRDLDRHEA